jgi:hypothetical protein
LLRHPLASSAEMVIVIICREFAVTAVRLAAGAARETGA